MAGVWTAGVPGSEQRKEQGAGPGTLDTWRSEVAGDDSIMSCDQMWELPDPKPGSRTGTRCINDGLQVLCVLCEASFV